MPADRASAAGAPAPWGRAAADADPAAAPGAGGGPDSALAGLDALQIDGGRRRTAGDVLRERVAPTLAALVAAVLLWQLLVALIDPRPDIMPGPLDVARQI